MSLGRELKEFSSAFGSTLNTMNTFGAMADRRDRRKARDAADPNKSPEVQNAEKQYYKDYGVKPPAAPATSFPADYEDRPTQDYQNGGLVKYRNGGDVIGDKRREWLTANTRAVHVPGTALPEDQPIMGRQDPFVGEEPWNEPPVPQPPENLPLSFGGPDEGGQQTGPSPDETSESVDRNDPIYRAKYRQPGTVVVPGDGRDISTGATMPTRQLPRKEAVPPGKTQAIPTSTAGTGTGTGGARAPAAQPAKRKALNDQTRTEAYDPELDGPTEAIPAAAPAAVTPAGDPPQGAAGPVDYQMTGAAGEGTSPSATADYTTALDGGIKFATKIFNLDGSGAALPGTDRNTAAGREAFFRKGTGAATPDMVRAIDQRVNQIPGVPNDEAIWGIRRLEAVYRFYSRRGETDKANKAVFELLQYSAGVAAKYGTAALDQLKANDQRGAVQTVVNGFNQIPNGQRATVNGQSVAITDARTGKTVQQIPITPQTVFNVALGLSDRSLYWDQLMSRAAATMKGRSTRTEAQEELTRAQTDLARKRAANVGVKGGGRAAATGPTGPAADLINDVANIRADRGKSTPAPPAAATPAAPGDGAGDTAGDGTGDDETDGAPATMPLGGARPANADGQGGGESGGLAADEADYMKRRADILAKTQPQPSLRVTPPRPGQAVPTAIDVAPAPAPASAPAAATRKNTPPVADDTGVNFDHDTVPDVEVVRDGARYRILRAGDRVASPQGKARPFDQPDPGPNPYAEAIKRASLLPPKDRTAAMNALRPAVAEYNDEVKQWRKARDAHIRAEEKRVKDEHTAYLADLKAKAKAEYDYKASPSQRVEIAKDINTAMQTAVSAAETNKIDLTNTIYKTVDAGKLRHLALEVMTSNPLPDADRAVGIVEQMTSWEDTDPDKRFYTPKYKDILGNVVVDVEGYGSVHLRPAAYEELTKLARANSLAAAKRRNDVEMKVNRAKDTATAAKAAAEKRNKERGETPFDAARRDRRAAPSSPTSALPTE